MENNYKNVCLCFQTNQGYNEEIWVSKEHFERFYKDDSSFENVGCYECVNLVRGVYWFEGYYFS